MTDPNSPSSAETPAQATSSSQAPRAPQAVNPDARPNRRRIREGKVISAAMDKTAVLEITDRVRHSRYNKIITRRGRLYVHDPHNDLAIGDRVRVQETRPLSKLKRWRILEVLERAR